MDGTDLAKYTRKELLALANQHEVKGVSRLRKKELTERLLQVFSPQPRLVPALSLSPVISVEQSQQTVASQDFIPQQLSTAESPEEQHSPVLAVSPAGQPEQAAMDSKFFLGPQLPVAVSEPDVLPASYNDNCIVLLARDPYSVHIYWDFNGERWTETQNQRDAADDRLVLRVFDVTYVEFNGANAWSSTDVELTPFSTSWYVSVPRPDAAYCAEIGYRSHTGRFVTLGRSNVVTTPRMEVSPITKVRWLTPPERQGTARQSQPLLPSPLSPDNPWNAANAASREPTPSSHERPSFWGTAYKG